MCSRGANSRAGGRKWNLRKKAETSKWQPWCPEVDVPQCSSGGPSTLERHLTLVNASCLICQEQA